MKNLSKVTYIWPDGHGKMRGKVRYINLNFETAKNLLDQVPEWRFDGGSTYQGDVRDSDRILKPVRLYQNFLDIYVICDVWNPDGSPHESNLRYALESTDNPEKVQLGVEQEFTLTHHEDKRINGEDRIINTGEGYCRLDNPGESIVSQLAADLQSFNTIAICGYNAEVTPGQWEYQIGPEDPLKLADDLMFSRYLLEKQCVGWGYSVTLSPKPYKHKNGAGCHINISTLGTRHDNLDHALVDLVHKFENNHEDMMRVYGEGNHRRMTGTNETSDYNKFSYGFGTRHTSIRIPVGLDFHYIEDRRPAANVDPYLAFTAILNTINGN